ncbi:MFS transporter [Brevibacterium spongiae]|uniref:MFS transporter n=1 Tax=Brevibacterium spongiae TaxID=2909672 RepID=A0ABY5SVB0_9MICO|nr:MFS transporter [Brevibacterium spongiae]UVI36649.1 MFS transporter [Brevibacterium spongiae]
MRTLSTTSATDAVRAKKSSSSGTGLIVVAGFSCLVVALQQTLVVPAVPVLPDLLSVSPVAVSWLVTATLLTGAVATPIIARLSDMFGRKRMLILSMVFVLIGSVIAPLGGLGTLITGRALQGLGTALVPVAMAQMRDSLPAHRVSSSLAILSATLGVGGGIGIPLGGLILDVFDWQSLFWTSAALSAASIVLIVLVMPAATARTQGRFDLLGAGLLTVGLSALLVGISQGNIWGWASAPTLVSFAVALVVLLAWGRQQLASGNPIVDLRATASAPLLFTNLASLILGMLMFANLLLTTEQLQSPTAAGGFGWSAAAAGLAMLPNAAAMFGVAPLTAWIAEHWGPRLVLALGGIVTAIGYLLRLVGSPSGAMVIVWATVIGIGVGIGYAALPMLIVRCAPGPQIGEANGVNALVRAIGTSIASAGVAAIGSIMAVSVEGVPVPSVAAFATISVVAGVGGLATVVCAGLARGEVRVQK